AKGCVAVAGYCGAAWTAARRRSTAVARMAGEFILSVAHDSTTAAAAPLHARREWPRRRRRREGRLRRRRAVGARGAGALHAHQMKPRYGGADRISTKAKLAGELRILGEAVVRARERAKLKQSDV